MFIICPKCGAKYKIPAETTLESGQKLKCSACDFVFNKGEEAPLPLTESADIPAEQPVSQKSEAFSKPIYHESDLNISARDSFSALPEAFQPVSIPTESHKSFWILLPLYIIIIGILCVAGWSFREMLKPTFSGYIPVPAKTQPAPTVAEPVLPKPATALPAPTFPKQPEQKPVETKPAPVVIPPVKPVAAKPVSQPQSVKPIEPKPVELKPIEVKTIEVKPVEPKPTEIKPIEVKPVVVKPEPVIPTPEKAVELPTPKEPEPILPATDTFALPDEPAETEQNNSSLNAIISTNPATDDEPLFEVVAEKPVPILTIQKLTHTTNQNSEGVNQLLIDGILKNTGDKPIAIPTLTAFVFDRDGHVLTQKQIFVSEHEISPDQEIPFYTGIVPAPEKTDHIDIKF